MENVAVLEGTFDPPHIGHYYLLRQTMEKFKCEYGLIIPNTDKAAKRLSGKKPTEQLIRTRMCQLFAHQSNDILAVPCAVQNNLLYTWQIIKFLKNHYTNYNFYYIFGGDWKDLKSFKKFDYIKSNVNIVQLSRPGYGKKKDLNVRFDLSSTILRERISEGLDVSGLIYDDVYRVIKKHKLYGVKC